MDERSTPRSARRSRVGLAPDVRPGPRDGSAVRRLDRSDAPGSRADDGFAMSSPLAFMCAAAVSLAGVAFVLTGPEEPPARPAALTPSASQVERAVTLRAVKSKPVVQRKDVYVTVFNNSNVTGLAGATAGRIAGAGWQVVGTDNWYGTIPATTIYYPPELQRAARLLSKDLGITRVIPAVDPMSMDRLTVILTADFA